MFRVFFRRRGLVVLGFFFLFGLRFCFFLDISLLIRFLGES